MGDRHPTEIADELAALIPQMEEDARIHRTWETPAAQADMAKPSERPLAEWVGDAAWHNEWASFYERAAATMAEAVALLRGENLSAERIAECCALVCDSRAALHGMGYARNEAGKCARAIRSGWRRMLQQTCR